MTFKNKWKVGGKRSDTGPVSDPITGAAVKTLDACNDLKGYKGTERPIHSRMSSAETDVPIAPLQNSASEESRHRALNYSKSNISTNVGVRRVVGNPDPLGATRPPAEQRISKARIVARDKGVANNKSSSGGHGHSRSSVKWDLPDRYKMVDIVGSGSYGQVCRAYDTEMQRYVAVKRIHKVFEDLIDCKRILREIAILGRLDHPNVVKILDICIPTNLENFDILYVVLEIAASDIKLLIRSPAFLTENHIRLLVYNLLNGVNYLHSVGIFHRDLKPANCLFNRDCSVKICDFGLARTATASACGNSDGDNCNTNTNTCEVEAMKCDALTHASTTDTLISTSTTVASGRSVYRDGCEGADYYATTATSAHTRVNSSAHAHVPSQPEQDRTRTRNDAFVRQLTGHVVTRWYRAPELILLKTDYNGAIDVWSIGCIFAELLNMMRSNVAEVSERSPLFPGSCCFPLSPDNKQGVNKENQRENDQLNVIFNVLGTPSQEDVDAIASIQVRSYVQLFKRRRGIDLAAKFKGASPEAIDLLKQMLTFNPDTRISCREAMQHDFFKQCFHARHLVVPSEHVQLPFDDWVNMTEGQLRFSILREIQRYHPEFRIPFNIIYRP